jgi:AcrR family transcriptional regulator
VKPAPAILPAEGPLPRVVGRPRSLTLDQLLDAAIAMGLQDLNMKELAARLGVGIATLYRYVENRDALIALAAGRQAYRHVPADTGQPWAEMVRAYAASLFSSIGCNPHLVAGFIEGRLGIAVEIEFVDNFLAALDRRGFSASEAMGLYRAVGQIVLGAAGAAAHFGALAAQETSQKHEIERALGNWEADEVPYLRKSAADYADETASCDWRPVLDAVLRDVARRRGEAID